MLGSDSASNQPASVYCSGSNKGSNYEEVSQQCRDRKRNSCDMGDHFGEVISGNRKKQAPYNYCQEVLSNGDDFDTSHWKGHLEEACPNYYETQIGSTVGSAAEFKFDQLKSRKSLAICCIKQKCPLNLGEYDGFRIFVHSLNPDFKIPNQDTVEADVIAVYEGKKVRVHKLLDDIACKVSLSTVFWTSDHSHVAYLCLTSHFIDDNWKLHEKVLAFKKIPNPDDGELFRCVKEAILEWKVGTKLCSIIVDNASPNDLMVEKLKEWLLHGSFVSPGRDLLHVKCCAHLINLIVRDGFYQISGLLEKIRETVRYLEASPFARQQFDQAKHQCGLEGKEALSVDVPNQWNSTFNLLEATLPLRKAFSLLQLMDEGYHLNPSDSEWGMAEVVLECLKVFYAATRHFSGDKHPTLSMLFINTCTIHLKLIEWIDSGDDFIRQISCSMKEKFDKYWDECNLLLATAVVFDPRYKMDLVKFMYKKIYGSAADSYIQKVRGCLDDLFTSYGDSIQSSANEAAVTSGSSDEDKHDDILEFERWRCESGEYPLTSELDIYLDQGRYPRVETFSVLDWWKTNSPHLPILGKIARDILAIPATTVISEAAFNVEGRILDESLASLRPEVVEALVVTNDWV